MVKKLFLFILSIFYLPVRYIKYCVFCKVLMRAEGGCSEHQAYLARLYVTKKDYINAYAWSYVSCHRGNKDAIDLKLDPPENRG